MLWFYSYYFLINTMKICHFRFKAGRHVLGLFSYILFFQQNFLQFLPIYYAVSRFKIIRKKKILQSRSLLCFTLTLLSTQLTQLWHCLVKHAWCLSSDCIIKYHKIGGLSATEMYLSLCWRLAIWDQGAPAQPASGVDPLAGCRLLTSLCILTDRGYKLSL